MLQKKDTGLSASEADPGVALPAEVMLPSAGTDPCMGNRGFSLLCLHPAPALCTLLQLFCSHVRGKHAGTNLKWLKESEEASYSFYVM